MSTSLPNGIPPIVFSPHNRGMKTLRNIVGPQIRKYRMERDWSQELLLAKLQVEGFLSKDRAGVAKIESQIICMCDYDLYYFARVFEVELPDLFPKLSPLARLDEQLTNLMRPRNTHPSLRQQK